MAIKKTDKKEGKSADKTLEFFKSFAENDEEIEVRISDEVIYDELPVISTGSLSLDDALSSGGIPKGRVVQFYGPAGSGKTLMTMVLIKQAQLEDPDAMQLFIDAEQTYDHTWGAALGIDPKRVIVVDGEQAINGRRCFTMLLGEPKEDKKTHAYNGKKVEGFLDKVAQKEMNFNLAILDSLGQLIPPGEDTAEVGKMNMALMSRFLTKELKRLTLEVKRANIAFVIINHQKASMSAYGADHTFSGGNTLNHTLSANIYFKASTSKDKVILDEDDNKVGGMILATVEKSKFGPWPRKCEFKVNFGIGIIDTEVEVYNLAIKYKVITKESSVTHLYKDYKWVGQSKVVSALYEDESLKKEIIDAIVEARRLDRSLRAQGKKLETVKVELSLEEEDDED
jgi:recombination protein RecA